MDLNPLSRLVHDQATTTTAILATICAVTATAYLYSSYKRIYSFWDSLGIPGPRPWPIVGNMLSYISTVTHDLDIEYYKRYGPWYGIYEGQRPVLVVGDPEMVKRILVKDFPLFVNRKIGPESFGDPARDNQMDQLYDTNWKRVRAIVGPTFSSGKIKKNYVPVMIACAQDALGALREKMPREHPIVEDHPVASKGASIVLKDVYGPYAISVVARCFFAIELNAHDGPTNPFVVNSKDFFNLSNDIIFTYFSRVGKVANRDPSQATEFFLKVAKEVVAKRQSSPLDHEDFLQLVVKATGDDADAKLSDVEMMAQCVLFLLVGYDTTGTTLTYTLWLLATNLEAQQRLYEEITENFGAEAEPDIKNSDDFYEKMMSLPYLDAVVTEAIRMFPAAPRFVTRKCGEDVTFDEIDPNTKIPKGTDIFIPLHPLHYNPKYYPEPYKFKPERWLKENRDSIVQYTYLPFGIGPRNCIAQRFALVEVKVAVLLTILQYKLEPIPGKTPLSGIEFVRGQENQLLPRKEIIVKMVPREMIANST